MKCPICSAEIEPFALSCPFCHAFQSVERTPLGVFSGWLGALSAIFTAMMILPVPIMIIAGVSLEGFPWILPLTGLCLAIASLWHSSSTKHIVWLTHVSRQSGLSNPPKP
jgi:hypothetical protein